MTTTATETHLDGAPRDAPTAPYLVLVLEGARPLAGGLRLRLDEIDEVVIGRGHERTATVTDRVLELRVPDRRMSATHARLKPSLAGWELHDAGSKNGSTVGGEMKARAALTDGVVLELGQTLFVFRTAWPIAGPAILEHPTEIAGVTTLIPSLAARLDEVTRLAPTRVSLVIGGETGTGKEVLARAVHAASERKGPLVAVNCAALPQGLVESELFGHRKGAFSGAIEDKPGLVRSADNGTLLLDEVGDLPPPAQAALLRVLQEREVVAVGDTRPQPVDVRVIAASHRDLPALVESNRFRADLWARLAGHLVRLPPLRERREDLGVLVAALLRRHAGDRADKVTLTAEAAHLLVTALWPLNVRALDKALETALALAGDHAIDVAHLREVHEAPAAPTPDDGDLRALLVALLTEHHGNVTQVAKAMGKARMQVQRWLRRFELDAGRYRP
jgi:transcriptional regulator of acetoin/glycerol metabolism